MRVGGGKEGGWMVGMGVGERVGMGMGMDGDGWRVGWEGRGMIVGREG